MLSPMPCNEGTIDIRIVRVGRGYLLLTHQGVEANPTEPNPRPCRYSEGVWKEEEAWEMAKAIMAYINDFTSGKLNEERSENDGNPRL